MAATTGSCGSLPLPRVTSRESILLQVAHLGREPSSKQGSSYPILLPLKHCEAHQFKEGLFVLSSGKIPQSLGSALVTLARSCLCCLSALSGQSCCRAVCSSYLVRRSPESRFKIRRSVGILAAHPLLQGGLEFWCPSKVFSKETTRWSGCRCSVDQASSPGLFAQDKKCHQRVAREVLGPSSPAAPGRQQRCQWMLFSS